MIKIGEKLNSSIPSTFAAFEKKDAAFVCDIAKKQADAGANYIDINTAMCENESEMLVWVAQNVQKTVGEIPLMIDCVNVQAIEFLFDRLPLKNPIINSVTLNQSRIDDILPLVKKYNTSVVAMPIDEDGIPKTAQQRVQNAVKLITLFEQHKIAHERIFVDIVVEAAATGWDAPSFALDATQQLRGLYPDVHLLAGLSNVSFGLPKRAAINGAFLTCAIKNGLDAAIMDVTSENLLLNIAATELMIGKDEYCGNYLQAFRELNQ
ncbi:MAG: dihydropteroate synthase [Christensenellaceae bacterium]